MPSGHERLLLFSLGSSLERMRLSRSLAGQRANSVPKTRNCRKKSKSGD